MKDEIGMVAIEKIRIANPRHRDKKKFQVVVESIRNVGLKKPIQVSVRRKEDQADGFEYDLVCGQGRLEAFMSLGHKEIPAVVVDITKEDRMLRGLIENMARRYPIPAALMTEIERLKDLGYSNPQVAEKLGTDKTTIGGYLTLKNEGEERLLDAAMDGRIPVTVAIEIAKAKDIETQRQLLKGYQEKQLSWSAIKTLKQLIDRRRCLGKGRDGGGRERKTRTSVESLVNTYKRESQRQKLLVNKAKLCDAKLVFIVSAFDKLLGDENFVTLLRAESLLSMPKNLWDKLEKRHKEAA